MSKRRSLRLSDLIKEELSSVLFYKMQDPRLSMCSITEVVLSSDYRHARVYVSVIGPGKHRDDCIEALNSAAGYIRHELRRLDLRHVPTLSFFPDTGAEYSQHIDELLKTVKKDEEPES